MAYDENIRVDRSHQEIVEVYLSFSENLDATNSPLARWIKHLDGSMVTY